MSSQEISEELMGEITGFLQNIKSFAFDEAGIEPLETEESELDWEGNDEYQMLYENAGEILKKLSKVEVKV